MGNNTGIAQPVTVSYQGLATAATNPLNQTRTEYRNALGELIEVVDAINGKLTYAFNAQGQLRRTVQRGNGDAAVVTIHICYDLLGRKTAMRDPDKGGYLGSGDNTCPTTTTCSAATTGAAVKTSRKTLATTT